MKKRFKNVDPIIIFGILLLPLFIFLVKYDPDKGKKAKGGIVPCGSSVCRENEECGDCRGFGKCCKPKHKDTVVSEKGCIPDGEFVPDVRWGPDGKLRISPGNECCSHVFIEVKDFSTQQRRAQCVSCIPDGEVIPDGAKGRNPWKWAVDKKYDEGEGYACCRTQTRNIVSVSHLLRTCDPFQGALPN